MIKVGECFLCCIQPFLKIVKGVVSINKCIRPAVFIFFVDLCPRGIPRWLLQKEAILWIGKYWFVVVAQVNSFICQNVLLYFWFNSGSVSVPRQGWCWFWGDHLNQCIIKLIVKLWNQVLGAIWWRASVKCHPASITQIFRNVVVFTFAMYNPTSRTFRLYCSLSKVL